MKFRNFHVSSIDTTLRYSNGRKAIQLTGTDNELIAVASVNIPEIQLTENEIAIKNYSENEGMLSFLIENGIVSEPVRYAETGYVKVPICTLLK